MIRRLPIYLIVLITLLTVTSIAFAQTVNEPSASAAGPRVRVVHLAPFAADAEDTAVTVTVNDEELLTDFKYTEFTDYVVLDAAGDIDVAVLVGDTPVIEETLTVAEDTDYTVAAIGEGNNQPLELWVQVDDNTPPAAGLAHVRIAHAAPFGDSDATTAVDICTQDGNIVNGLANIPYQAASDYLPLPAGTYDLKVAFADATPCAGLPVIDPLPITLPEGAVLTLYASGDGINQLTGLLAVPFGVLDVIPPLVQVVHVAPFSPSIADTAVGLAVNGQPLPGQLRYLQDTDYVPLPLAGSYLFEVLVAGEVALSETVIVGAGAPQTIAAIGDGTNQPLELLVLADDFSPPESGNGKIRIVHAAPFAADIDDTRVDICTQNGDPIPGLVGVPYRADTGFLSLAAGSYDLKVTATAAEPCTGEIVFDTPPIALPDGGIATVFAVGGANGQMAGAFIPGIGPIGISYVVYMPVILK